MEKQTTAQRLKQAMRVRNLRQTDILHLAEPYCKKYNVKLSKSDLSQFVNGKVIPGQWKLTILGLALNVSEAWLMGYDVSMNRNDNVEEGNEVKKWLIELSSEFKVPLQILKDIFLGFDFATILSKNELNLTKDNLRKGFQRFFAISNSVNIEMQKLSQNELKLIKNYRLLNDEGKATALDSVEALTCLPKYKKSDNSEELA